MVLRQVIFGVSGGAALAGIALFLPALRPVVAERAPDWSRSFLTQAAAALSSPTDDRKPSETTALVWKHSTVDGSWADDDDLLKSDVEPAAGRGISALSASENKLDVSGVRVAGLHGAGVAESDIAESDIAHSPPLGVTPSSSSPLPARGSKELDPDLYVGALSKQTIIRSAPDIDAPIVGFARTGALLRRAATAAGTVGCRQGWYRVEPDGYICVGKTATLDPEHPLLRLASYQPDRTRALPYPYGKSRFPTSPLYTKIPTREQQQLAEADLVSHLSKKFGTLWADQADTPPPSLLADAARIPRPFGYPQLDRDFMTGRALVNSTFAFIDLFEAEGRRWGLTADLSLIALDRVQPVHESDFFGEVLSEQSGLPVAFERSRAQLYYQLTDRGVLRPTRAIRYREAFRLTGREKDVFGATYLETRDGGFIRRHDDLVVIQRRDSMPKWATGTRTWLEVSILKQTLVAYVGDRPVFATLVSTGKDGLGDPETTHSTVLGTFLIHTKHVTSTMSGDAADDEFDLRDVPYVQYFHQGYALHSAFWHDHFGTPRSHGCVNLSPADARHLFAITEPAVPLRWHSALSREGTLITIRP